MKLTPLLFCFSAIFKPPVIRTTPALIKASQILYKHTYTKQIKQLKKEIEELEKNRSKEVDELCNGFVFDMHVDNFGTLNKFGRKGIAITTHYDAKIKTLKKELKKLQKQN